MTNHAGGRPRKDGERYANGHIKETGTRSRDKTRNRRASAGQVIAIDGEGKNLPNWFDLGDMVHSYTLLCASDGNGFQRHLQLPEDYWGRPADQPYIPPPRKPLRTSKRKGSGARRGLVGQTRCVGCGHWIQTRPTLGDWDEAERVYAGKGFEEHYCEGDFAIDTAPEEGEALAWAEQEELERLLSTPQIIEGDTDVFADKVEDIYDLLATKVEQKPHRRANLGLQTIQCLEFLLNLPPDALKVGFAFSYDTVMILFGDLDLWHLRHLWKFGWVKWQGYQIEWVPRKQLTIKRGKTFQRDKNGKHHVTWARSCVVWDVFGFWQCSFVTALREFKIGTPEIWDRIQAMKEQRADFADVADDKIRAYCYEECDLLSALFSRLLELNEALPEPLHITRYDGVGALAAAWMKQQHIKRYIGEPTTEHGEPIWDERDDTQHRLIPWYFGGRFEIATIGKLAGPSHLEDINSAYIAAAYHELPCLSAKCGNYFERTKEYLPGRFGFYEVTCYSRGDGELPTRWAPFPWRDSKGNVYYGHDMEGRDARRWIPHPEVAAAIKWNAGKVTIHDGWVLVRGCDHHPFAKVQEMYDLRLRMKAEGKAEQLILKRTLASIYGKTVQSVGPNKTDPEYRPPFQCYPWGAVITSSCRAQVYDAAMSGDVHSIATDGIIATNMIPNLERSTRLGAWDHSTVTDLYLFQPGIYAGQKEDGTELYKSRGYAPKEIPAQLLRDAWDAKTTKGIRGIEGYTAKPRTKFMGMGSALSRRDPMRWIGRWVQEPRTIKMLPSRRFLVGHADPYYTDDHPGWELEDSWDTIPATIDRPSASYKVKRSWSEVDEISAEMTRLDDDLHNQL